MGNKKYYRKNYNNNNNNKKNYYFKNKKYNHKDNNYQYDNSHFDVNRIEELVNNNLGDDKINNNEFKEEEFIPKKKDNHDFSLDDIQKDVYKLSKTESLGVDVNTDDLKDEIEVEIKKKPRKNLLIKTSFGYALGIIILLLAIVGTTYSYFNYTRESTQADIVTGDIYVKVVEDTVNLNNKLYPTTKEAARSKTDNVVTFTVKGLNTSDKTIYYEIKLNYGDSKTGTRFNDKDLVFDLIEVGQNNEETYRANAKSFSDIANGARIWVDTIPAGTTEEITKTYKLRMWLSDKVTIDDDNGTYPASTYNTYYATINASVFGDFTEKEISTAYSLVKKAINNKINAENNACNPIWIDNNGTANDESDDITYFSGTNECVDMNYVWYSGKLWRITAIYPNGSMKMITEDALTAIYWGSTVEYDGSWVYQWLNEDFYDTLVNPSDIIIANSSWNYSTDSSSTPKKPERIETQKTKTAPIGLLNAYEYYNAYRKATSSTNYLNIGYFWWLITSYSTSRVRYVIRSGSLGNSSTSSTERGVRPSVVIKSGLEFAGSGTKTNPYKIVGDKEDPTNGTLISSRSVGEYVKFDNDIYRIVSIDETSGTTKLTRVDYLRDNGTVITKNFASSAYFGKSTNTQEDTYWDYYLNNTWYNSISSTYKDMLIDGTYYLGLYAGNGEHYKITTCKDTASALDSITTKNCTKYTSSDTDKTFTGKIGLPRVGEMFSSQLGSGLSSSSATWTITPHSTSTVYYMVNDGSLGAHTPSSDAYCGVRPSIVIKSGIKITGGTGYIGGDTNSPFEISE